jgi:hypothetical protein
MGYTVVYWNRATDAVYETIRCEMPPGWTLITPSKITVPMATHAAGLGVRGVSAT